MSDANKALAYLLTEAAATGKTKRLALLGRLAADKVAVRRLEVEMSGGRSLSVNVIGNEYDYKLDTPLATESGKHWVTIGGHPDGKNGMHVGGFPVLLDGNGQVLSGKMKGKHISQVKEAFDKNNTSDNTKKKTPSQQHSDKHNKGKSGVMKSVRESLKLHNGLMVDNKTGQPANGEYLGWSENPNDTVITYKDGKKINSRKVGTSASQPKDKKVLTNPELTSEDIINHYQNWINSTPKNNLSKIENYCGQSSVYDQINGILRGNLYDDDFNDDPKALTDIHNTIKEMDAMLALTPPLKSDATVYRGVYGDFVKKLRPGNIVSDSGFVSTAYAIGSAEQALSGAEDDELTAMIHINVPKGTRALPGSEMLKKLQPDNYMEEYELVLPRGSKFKVISRTKVSSKNYKVVVELL